MKALRILVVEDNAVIGMLLSLTLKAMGHEVCAVEASEDRAVATALRCSPDLMIVDVALGHGSGLRAVETILRTRHVPHIFMSGAPLQTGVRGSIVLRKPFVEAELAVAIEHAVTASAEASASP
ncbi:response regulator [Roseomonas rosulenta]|uniref:response regulator n=1 Tax=Roseomonas rosulenta TaxID=2748667 RepID=UPI0018DFA95E|nr:response regulator [Roseomonas rosulenta]